MNRIIVVLLLLMGAFESQAQDPQYTQFYANPLYLNPAFAGATSDGRVSVNYRNQWPSLAANFITYSASYDQYIPSIRSGIGVFVNNDRIQINGQGNLPPFSSTTVTGNYSYVAPLNDNLALQLGLSAGVINRAVNFNQLIFFDEINDDGSLNFGSPDRQALLGRGNAARRTVLDFGVGGLLYSSNLWLGLAISHLNQPNMSILGTTTGAVTGTDILPMKISLHGGYKINLTDQTRAGTDQNDMSITPAFVYKRQRSSQQLSLGAYFNYQPLLFGLWYRGIPIDVFAPDDATGSGLAESTITNQDAVSILVGVMTPQYSIGYSYDITIGNGLRGNTGGTHEISITYNIGTDLGYQNGRPKRSRFGKLYCPNPWKQYQKAR